MLKKKISGNDKHLMFVCKWNLEVI